MSFYLIQQLRLVHALTESEYDIAIPAQEEAKFQMLRETFGVKFRDDTAKSFNITRHLHISHTEPMTSLGEVARPLIFPHAITSYCRSLWTDTRDVRFSFQGLLSRKRKPLIENWIEKNLSGQRIRLPDQRNALSRLRKKIFTMIGFDESREMKIGELLLRLSDRGRRFPIKAWDDEYFRLLASSQFVLCPSGDWVWSYRFFESTLCGAIPIVEEDCNAYNGFRYHSLRDAAGNLKWSEEDAEYNYGACLKRLTVPAATLNFELAKILERCRTQEKQ